MSEFKFKFEFEFEFELELLNALAIAFAPSLQISFSAKKNISSRCAGDASSPRNSCVSDLFLDSPLDRASAPASPMPFLPRRMSDGSRMEVADY